MESSKSVLILRKAHMEKNTLKGGGGKLGTDRLIDGLIHLGYKVDTLNLPYFEGKSPLIYFIKSYLLVLGFLLSNSPKKYSLIHVVVYLGSTRYLELLTICLTKFRWPKKKLMLEVRGGYPQNKALKFFPFKVIPKIVDKLALQIPDKNKLLEPQSILPNYCDFDTGEYTESKVLRICYVGRLELNKGIYESLDVLELLKANDIPFVYNIVGEGSELNKIKQNTIQKRLNKNVKFLGNLDREKVRDFWKEQDVFLFLTSNPYEGQSNSLTESIHSKTLPICSDIEANRQTLKNIGPFFDKNDANAIAAYIKDILSNQNWKKKELARYKFRYHKEYYITELKNFYTF